MHQEHPDQDFSQPDIDRLEQEAAETIQLGLKKMQEQHGSSFQKTLETITRKVWEQLEANTIRKS